MRKRGAVVTCPRDVSDQTEAHGDDDTSLGARLGDVDGGPDMWADHARAQLRASLFGGTAEPIRLGRYRVVRRLGEGAMGVVYAGHDDKLDRPVALKLLHTADRGRSGERYRQRLVREGQALAQVSHPNVAGVYEVGEARESIYIAMEYIEGRTLKQWIEEERPEVDDILSVIFAVGEGLSAVHDAGLLHRDVKPTNILVDVQGRARLIDFGLAKLGAADSSSELATPQSTAPSAASLSSDLTQTGARVGTPAYMAPEQLFPGTATPRSDQFSLCVVLYEMLYGQRPFAAGKWAASLSRGANGLVFPGDVAVPRRVRKALRRGLSLHAAERFPSVRALLNALRRSARPWWGVAVAAGAVCLPVALLWPIDEDTCSAGAKRVEQVWNADKRARTKERLVDSHPLHGPEAAGRVTTMLDVYAGEWAAAHQTVCERTGHELDAGMACLGRRLAGMSAWVDVLVDVESELDYQAIRGSAAMLAPVEPCKAVRGDETRPAPPPASLRPQVEVVRGQLAHVAAIREAGQLEDAVPLAEDAVAKASALGYMPLTADAWTELGKTHDARGDSAAAESLLMSAFWAASSASADRAAVEAAAFVIHVIGEDIERRDEARMWLRSAEVHADRLDDGAGSRARLLEAAGNVEVAAGHPEEALRLHREAYAIWIEREGEDSHDVAVNLTNQGTALQGLGEFAAARGIFRRAQELFEAHLGHWHPRVAMALARLANTTHADGDYESAAQQLTRAFEIVQATTGADTAEGLMIRNGLAVSWESLGELNKAAEMLRGIIETQRGGASQLNRGVAHENLGRVLHQLGLFEEALSHQRVALDLRVQVFGDGHPLVSGPLTGIGQCLVALGRSEEALDPLSRALEIREQGGAGPRYLAPTRFALSQALAESDPGRARSLLDAAAADAEKLDDSDPRNAAIKRAIQAEYSSPR